jgi:hypothetical protein
MNYTQEEDKEVMDLQIRDLYDNMALTGLLPKDQHLFSIPLHCIFALPRPRKVEWIEQSHLAVAQAKKRNFNLRRSRYEQQRHHQLMMASMQNTLSSWLSHLH